MISAVHHRRWPSFSRPLAVILAASAALFLFIHPAHAEKKAFGDIVVEQGETYENDVSTSVGDIEVLGEVEGDVKTAKGNIIVLAPVDGDVKSGMGNVRVEEPVDGNVETGFGNVFIDSEVEGHVAVEGGNVELGPGARVAGKVYQGSGQFRTAPGARFDGTTAGMASDFDDVSSSERSSVLGFLGWMLAAAVFVAASLLATVVAPRPLAASSRRIGEAPVWSLFAGIASVVAALVLFVVLLVSGIGIPILVLLAPLYIAFVFFGAIVAAYFVGRKVALATGRHRSGNAFAAVVGALIVAAVYFLPLGLLLFCLISLLGAGAALIAIFDRRPRSYAPFSDRRG